MGIPSYFSYIVKNHGSIIRRINALKDPVNNLYLDSNSIIYDIYRNVPIEGKVKKVYEADIVQGVINKIIEYINNVKPKDNIIIAFDGVAPVAKLEQQRNRRYKSMFEKQFMNNYLQKILENVQDFTNCFYEYSVHCFLQTLKDLI